MATAANSDGIGHDSIGEDRGLQLSDVDARESSSGEMKKLPWPTPSSHDQFQYSVLAVWMWVVPCLIWMPKLLAWKNTQTVYTLWIWVASCVMSPIHWGKYIPKGPLQTVDMIIASSLGLGIIIETAIYCAETKENLAVRISAAVFMVLNTFFDMVTPGLDGHNGLFLHLLLRFSSGWALLALAGCPDASYNTTTAVITGTLLMLALYTAHGCVLTYLFSRTEKTVNLLANESAQSNQDQPSMAFKVRVVLSAFLVVAIALTFIVLLWSAPES